MPYFALCYDEARAADLVARLLKRALAKKGGAEAAVYFRRVRGHVIADAIERIGGDLKGFPQTKRPTCRCAFG